MKGKLFGIGVTVAVLIASACGLDAPEPRERTKTVTEKEEKVVKPTEEMIIMAEIGGEDVEITMYDNPTSRDFINQLPLELSFKDFGGFEKLSYPPKKLTTEGAPEGDTPSAGDFAYYAPWGDVTLYYKDESYAKGVVLMGRMEDGGIEKVAGMGEDEMVRLREK
ncbi:cyclophilin-like fold protein [Rossellomorea marisflavi]|uniref:cyclophilin-like fold protein n=1 Tax=Rossellomorea marisflavi TaxID=189381 RepID=UPI00203EEC94|nr:cyclophilin-like fold protein [Rossellomorea marisflavi]MCM2603286.1 cyclophilin-like fold protein [Rossellomorea marisflavi]